jgi:cytochrome c-type biogenesis protein CcmH
VRAALLWLAALTLAAPALAQSPPAAPAYAPDYAQVSLADPAKERQALALMDTIRCVVCQGQPISGSDAEIAGDMRRIIRERIAGGETPEAVRAWLVSRYGDWVTFKPQVKPETAPLWLLPLLALVAGLWLMLRRLKLRRGRGSG